MAKVEVVTDKPQNTFFDKIGRAGRRIKLGIAILLDGIDFLIGWIPLVNTAWDIVCFFILLILLKNKKLAFISLIELPLLGLPPFSIIDMFLPICTVAVLIDNGSGQFMVKQF